MVIETYKGAVYVSGSLRGNQWPVIKTTAYLALRHHPLGILIDFSGVQWVPRSGESTLVAAMNEIEQHNLPFTLLNVSSSIEPLLSTSISRGLAERSETWWKRLWGTA